MAEMMPLKEAKVAQMDREREEKRKEKADEEAQTAQDKAAKGKGKNKWTWQAWPGSGQRSAASLRNLERREEDHMRQDAEEAKG